MVSGTTTKVSSPVVELPPVSEWTRGRATREDVLAAIDPGADLTCVVDALTAESFGGREANYGRPGHIPGAVNVPFTGLIERESCGFVDADTMAERLGDVLEAPRVITYCGGAIAATVPAFCLRLLGRDDVAVYDGSLMEWAADPTLPMVDPNDRAT